MNHKKLFILLLILPIMLLTGSGCNGLKTGSTLEEHPEPSANGSESGSTPTDPQGPFTIDISFSELPKLGETSELTFTTSIHYLPLSIDPQSMANAQAWMEFSYANTRGSYSEAKYAVPVPLDEVLVSGELTWEGNTDESWSLELNGTIQLPREGVWRLTGFFSAEGWEEPFMKERWIAVTEDAAAIVGTQEFKSGPLGYLDNFPYGHISGKRIPDERFDPVILELDISKIPRAGEEAAVTCHILSILDVPDYSVQISFKERLEDYSILRIPGDDLLVDGNLEWEGNLEKDKPVEFSVSIKFPEDGDWEIMALGRCPTNDKLEFADIVKMNITGDRGYFGWGKRRAISDNFIEPAPTPPSIPE